MARQQSRRKRRHQNQVDSRSRHGRRVERLKEEVADLNALLDQACGPLGILAHDRVVRIADGGLYEPPPADFQLFRHRQRTRLLQTDNVAIQSDIIAGIHIRRAQIIDELTELRTGERPPARDPAWMGETILAYYNTGFPAAERVERLWSAMDPDAVPPRLSLEDARIRMEHLEKERDELFALYPDIAAESARPACWTEVQLAPWGPSWGGIGFEDADEAKDFVRRLCHSRS